MRILPLGFPLLQRLNAMLQRENPGIVVVMFDRNKPPVLILIEPPAPGRVGSVEELLIVPTRMVPGASRLTEPALPPINVLEEFKSVALMLPVRDLIIIFPLLKTVDDVSI